MPQTAPDIRKRELAQIHIAKSQLGIDDETYRAMLWTVARVKSAAELDFSGRKRVLDHLKSRGFKVVSSRKSAQAQPVAPDPQTSKIVALWRALHGAWVVRDPSMKALGKLVHRQTGVARPEWLSNRAAESVIEALKAWAAREGCLVAGEVA